jgi:hypoxanthine phosphoribosyltransferase
MGQKKKFKITWKGYHDYIEKLGNMVRKSRWKPNVIVCISRGGLPVGLMLSEYLKKPLGVITVQSYHGTKQGRLKFNKHISTIAPIRGKILLADDLVDSGKTITATKRYLEKFGTVRTAVMFRKTCAKFMPDYFVRETPGGMWIVFPYNG